MQPFRATQITRSRPPARRTIVPAGWLVFGSNFIPSGFWLALFLAPKHGSQI